MSARTPRPLRSTRSSVLFALLAMATLTTLVGCELDDTETGDASDAIADTTDTDTPDDTPDDTVEPPAYRFVRILDQSDRATTTNGGADIDAIILDKIGGEQFFAEEVIGFNHGGGVAEGPDLDPRTALNAPDSFSSYTDAETAVCDLDAGYVSLGGDGGFLIVEMGGDIETGDTVTVLEVGGCQGNSGEPGIVEEVTVEISVSSEIDAQWVTLGTAEGPIVSFDVPEL